MATPAVELSFNVKLVSDVADASAKPLVVEMVPFLRPRAGDGAAPPAPPGGPGPVPARPHEIEAELKGWAGVPRRWAEWVDKLRGRHEPLWRKLGILDGILASTYQVRRRDHENMLLQLVPFWNEATGTFVFPWGEATVTLNDIDVLAGLPLFGVSVREPVSDDSLEKDVAKIQAVRALLNKSKAKKPSYIAWVDRFVDRAPEELVEEHGAFLSMWLSFFVFPAPPFNVVRREVLPIAARLARGESVALAPAALAAIYHDLSALKRRITSGEGDGEPLVVSAPMHILQLWVWEHFTQLSPEPAAAPSAQEGDDHHMPRAARWHEVEKMLSSKEIHAVFTSPDKFQWRPYGDRTLFSLRPVSGGFWGTATDEDRVSLLRCLHACELVGMNCIEQYSPHRVARQLGFHQDIPGMVPRVSSSWEEAWETYSIKVETLFMFPREKPGVTVRYAEWWKPYPSACDSGTANAAEMKQGHGFDNPGKRKMEAGALAGSSGKTLRMPVPTATQRPRVIIELIDEDELDEETSKKAGVSVEATSKEDAPSTMHLKTPEMHEPARTKEGNLGDFIVISDDEL